MILLNNYLNNFLQMTSSFCCFFYILFMNDFLDLTPKIQATTAKIYKWDYFTLKSFCTTKEKINQIKR